MAIDKELLDRLLEGREPSELFARDGLLDDLQKAISERILNAEPGASTWAAKTRPSGAIGATGLRRRRC